MKRILLCISLVVFTFLQGFSQTVVNLDGSTHGSTQTGCSFWFYDDGGVGSAYTNNQDRWITFHSNNVTNTHMRLSFASFNIDNSDTLFVYDGSSTAAPLIGMYNASNPLTIPTTMVQASIYNASGDLTVRFKSNASGTMAGWNASVDCVPMCQTVIPTADTLVMIPLPDDSGYVDICFGEPIKFAGLGAGPGAFPQNDILYHQDSLNSMYIWDFGDGVIDTGRVIWHTYTTVSGYDVYMRIVDVNGCQSTLLYSLKVRISDDPIVAIKPLPDICVGDQIDLVVGTDGASTIVVAPTGSVQVATAMYDSVTFIPDGPSCPVTCYGTPVIFNSFPAGATITSASDIASICMGMEHTFAGDLAFRIICPNGQNVVLDSYDNSGGSDFGISNSSDGSPICTPTNNPPGTGRTYCWSELYPQQGLLNTLDGGTSPIPATDTINLTGYITPENPLSGLVGCPLNGTWSIEICDHWGADNGYVFWWALTLTNQNISGAWSYTVDIDSVTWSGPYISSTSDSTAIIYPTTPGIFNYTATVWDEYGCSYDTTFQVEVLANPDPYLGADTNVCADQIVTLYAGPGNVYHWSTGQSTQSINTNVNGLYSVTVTNTNGNVSCFGYDSIQVIFIPWAEVDLGPDQCQPNGPVVLDAGNPGYLYSWSTGGSSQTEGVNSTGNYSVTVSYGGYNMCADADTVHIRIIPDAILDLGPDFEMCRHEERILDATQTSLGHLFQWSNGYTSPMITLVDMDAGIYMYSVDVIGCDTVSDSITVVVLPCDLTIPNIITPNSDGINDVFKVINLEFYPNSVLTVYNRWGNKVYENSNYQCDWDGEDAPDGTYFFILKANEGEEEYVEYHGTITILGKQ